MYVAYFFYFFEYCVSFVWLVCRLNELRPCNIKAFIKILRNTMHVPSKFHDQARTCQKSWHEIFQQISAKFIVFITWNIIIWSYFHSTNAKASSLQLTALANLGDKVLRNANFDKRHGTLISFGLKTWKPDVIYRFSVPSPLKTVEIKRSQSLTTFTWWEI